jgi:hypothetical protein
MRTVKWNAFLSGLCGFAVALGVLAASAHADVVTEKGASILIFPKVIANAEYDTIIQISNIANNMVHARCFYVNSQLPPGCEIEDPRVGCIPSWDETDFSIWLTKQQPTHWLVSAGRPVDPSDNFQYEVATPMKIKPFNGAGIDPGSVPPVPDGFTGELKCIQVMADGTPIGANSLKGEATIEDVAGPSYGDVSKYNAIGVQGTEAAAATCGDPTQDCFLQLNNPRGTTDGEYNACPQTLVLNHFADVGTDPVSDADIRTQLTLVPCSENFETQTPSHVIVQFLVYNEFESRFSTSTTVTCWKNTFLTDIDSPNNPDQSVFSAATLGSAVAQTRMNPADPTDGTFNGAVVGVAETIRSGATSRARTAHAIHTEGDRFTGTDGGAFDQIILPRLF